MRHPSSIDQWAYYMMSLEGAEKTIPFWKDFKMKLPNQVNDILHMSVTYGDDGYILCANYKV